MKKQQIFMLAMAASFLVVVGVVFLGVFKDFLLDLFGTITRYYSSGYEARGIYYRAFSMYTSSANSLNPFDNTYSFMQLTNLLYGFVFVPVSLFLLLIVLVGIYFIGKDKLLPRIIGLVVSALAALPLNLLLGSYALGFFMTSIHTYVLIPEYLNKTGSSSTLYYFGNSVKLIMAISMPMFLVFPFLFFALGVVFTFVKKRESKEKLEEQK